MTTTSQALSGVEAATYKRICDKFATLSKEEQEELRKEQAGIVAEAIRGDVTIQTKIAELIRDKILGNPRFNS
jgi:hypothetical protein